MSRHADLKPTPAAPALGAPEAAAAVFRKSTVCRCARAALRACAYAGPWS
ncbi:hypothetical protein ACFP1Z_24820 [Streptomyces gamaensis]|uniref:Uncharacterized protein n=1 Tax=Streptomyces gamaensis TaxID=1763542 RepID=A0ABW0Z7T9_9ACTN